jgi:hypothetical protein
MDEDKREPEREKALAEWRAERMKLDPEGVERWENRVAEWRKQEMERDPEGFREWARRVEFLSDPRHKLAEWQGVDWFPQEQKEHDKKHGREHER